MARKAFLHLIMLGSLAIPWSVHAADLPAAAAVTGISGRPQSLPLDCEARSAVDWAAFFGVAINEITFFEQLPKTDNPETGFIGNVYDSPGNLPPRGYGIYAGPVANLLKTYGLPAEARRNASEFELQAEIAAGWPAIVWYIYGFRVAPTYERSSADGSVYKVAAFEHTGLVIAYDSVSYTVIDAFSGLAHRVDRAQFLNSWSVLGYMAIFGGGSAPSTPVPAAPAPAITPSTVVYYTVQRGDYLSKIAQQFGIQWTDLAAANNIYSPYIIYPGQQLLIPGSGAPAPASPAPLSAPPNVENPPATYTVQRGDTLSLIAQRFGLYWPSLAAANGIVWPYTIYPGQVLILPGR